MRRDRHRGRPSRSPTANVLGLAGEAEVWCAARQLSARETKSGDNQLIATKALDCCRSVRCGGPRLGVNEGIAGWLEPAHDAGGDTLDYSMTGSTCRARSPTLWAIPPKRPPWRRSVWAASGIRSRGRVDVSFGHSSSQSIDDSPKLGRTRARPGGRCRRRRRGRWGYRRRFRKCFLTPSRPGAGSRGPPLSSTSCRSRLSRPPAGRSPRSATPPNATTPCRRRDKGYIRHHRPRSYCCT
jgi:hypothetical protein